MFAQFVHDPREDKERCALTAPRQLQLFHAQEKAFLPLLAIHVYVTDESVKTRRDVVLFPQVYVPTVLTNLISGEWRFDGFLLNSTDKQYEIHADILNINRFLRFSPHEQNAQIVVAFSQPASSICNRDDQIPHSLGGNRCFSRPS
jgi:hypothetical protein